MRPVALVTGGARRLGREIALELARQGWDLALHYRHSAAEAEATLGELRGQGARAEGFSAELDDEAACRALVPAVVARLGRLDAVVNNASTFAYDDAASFGHAAMERHWRANVAAPVLLSQALHAHLAGSGREGCVVNLSDQKLVNLNPDHFSYTLSKAALAAATTMLAQALAPLVRVCAVAPGLTLGSELIDEAALARLDREQPFGRRPAAGDIARAVAFLLSCPSITGETLLVDAGQHLAAQSRDFAFQPAARQNA